MHSADLCLIGFMRHQSTIENLAKQHSFWLKESKRHMAWEHKVNLQTVVTPMTQSDRRSFLKIEKRFQQVAQLSSSSSQPAN
jgi:hypothetical protein